VNPKIVMGIGVLLWSLAQMISPYAAAAGLPQLLACRFAMGMSESVTIPTIQVRLYYYYCVS
jgi:MFS family permease